MIRIGIVGCGEAAQVIHLPVLREARDKFCVTALCDASRQVVDQVGGIWGIGKRYVATDALVADENVDAVLVTNPHALHAETALAAMAAGKHVFIEKPMCLTLAEADQLLAGQKKSNVTVQIGYMRRYAPAFAEAAKLLGDGRDIRLARVHCALGRNALINTQIANVARGTDMPAATSTHLQTLTDTRIAEAIGAEAATRMSGTYQLLLGLSSHDLSAMRELLGVPRRLLFATSRGPEGRSIAAAFDYGHFVCQFSSEVDTIPRFDAHIEVFTPARIIRVEYDTAYVRGIPGRLVVTDVDDRGMARTSESLAWRDSFLLEWLAFHDNITNKKTPKTSIADARQDLLLFKDMIAAMQQSAQN
jgi:predicted dehydrogenase